MLKLMRLAKQVVVVLTGFTALVQNLAQQFTKLPVFLPQSVKFDTPHLPGQQHGRQFFAARLHLFLGANGNCGQTVGVDD